MSKVTVNPDYDICHGCQGRGWVTVGRRAVSCPICKGKGYVASDAIREETRRKKKPT